MVVTPRIPWSSLRRPDLTSRYCGLHLRLPVPFRRRRHGFRAVHVESLEDETVKFKSVEDVVKSSHQHRLQCPSLLDAAMAAPDAPIAFAECFTFITTTGTQYAWTNVGYPVTYNGSAFLADGPLVQGLKYKSTSASKSTSSKSPSLRGRRTRSTARRSLSLYVTGHSTARLSIVTGSFSRRLWGGRRRRADVRGPRLNGRQCRADAGDADRRERSRDPRL